MTQKAKQKYSWVSWTIHGVFQGIPSLRGKGRMHAMFIPALFLCLGLGFGQEKEENKAQGSLLFPVGWVERVLEAAVLSNPGENVVISPMQIVFDLSYLHKFGTRETRKKIEKFIKGKWMYEPPEIWAGLIVDTFKRKIKGKGFVKDVLRGEGFGEGFGFSFGNRVPPIFLKVFEGVGLEKYLESIQLNRQNVGWKKILKIRNSKDRAFCIKSWFKFNARWSCPFRASRKGLFYFSKVGERAESGQFLDVEFMHQRETTPFGYVGNLLFQAVFIPLRGDFSFVVVVPREWDGLLMVLTRIGQDGGLGKRTLTLEDSACINLSLPKIKFSYKNQKFLEVLRRAGLNGGIVALKGRKGVFPVSGYHFEAGICVNEKGVGASSYTKWATPLGVERKEVVKVDRPFIFYLYSSYLFPVPVLAGVVFKPQASGNESGVKVITQMYVKNQ